MSRPLKINNLGGGVCEVSEFISPADVSDDDTISQSSVIQHEAAITHGNITGTGANSHPDIDAHIADLGIHTSSEHYYSQQIPVTNTTSSVFVAHHTFVTPALMGGTYRAEWSYGFSNDNTVQGAIIQVRQPGGTPGGDPVQTDLLNFIRLDPQDSGGTSRIGGTGTDQENTASGFIEYSLPAGAITLVIEVRSPTGAITSVWGSKISITRTGP